jgi:hypothetical protein
MPSQNNFWKTTLGVNAEVLVGKGVQWTDDATFVLFVANAVEGELGLFNYDTGASYYDGINTDVPAATDLVFFAMKRDGLIERSSPFKTGEVKATRTVYEAPVKQVTTVTVGAVTVVKGDILGIKLLETTPGYDPFPTYEYEVTVKQGEALDTAMNRLVAVINDAANKANRDRDLIVTAGYTDATNVLLLTAKNFGCTFRVILKGKLYDGDAATTVVYTTPAKLGSGFPAQVRAFQTFGDIYKGVTTQYPLQGANPADFGAPTDFVSDALTYNIYTFSGNRKENSRTHHKVQNYPHTILVIVPATGASAEEEVKAIFGL